MFRSSIFKLLLIIIFFIPTIINGKNTNNRRLKVLAAHKPISIKICGLALTRLLDMVCTRTGQILIRNGITSPTPSISSPTKEPSKTEDNTSIETDSIIIHQNTTLNDTLIDDCCRQACTLKTLLKYCLKDQ